MGKRRTFTPDFKLEAVLDMVRGEKTIAQICRERDITESLLYKWRDAFFERAPALFTDQRSTGKGRRGLATVIDPTYQGFKMLDAAGAAKES